MAARAGAGYAVRVDAGQAAGLAEPHPWVTTWARTLSTQSLDEVLPGATPPRAPVFAERTLRSFLRVSLGGGALRIRLSNAYGSEPLGVGALHVALRESGARIVPGSDRVASFGGRSSAEIPGGAVAVSDPVALEVPALADVAVSLYLPSRTRGATAHACGIDTHHVLAGDQAGVVDPVIESTTTVVFFLAGIDVAAPHAGGAVACLGDSLTAGIGSTPDAHRAWPDLLAARLAARHGAARPLAVLNQGYAGNRLLHDRCGPSALARFDRDVLELPGVTDVIVFEGINDIGMPRFGLQDEAVTADDLVAAYRRLIARARAAGLRIHGATLTPFAGADPYTRQGDRTRQAVNGFIRSSGEFDSVSDFDAAVRDAANPAALRPEYDAGDHVHLSDAGHAALSRAVDLRSFR